MIQLPPRPTEIYAAFSACCVLAVVVLHGNGQLKGQEDLVFFAMLSLSIILQIFTGYPFERVTLVGEHKSRQLARYRVSLALSIVVAVVILVLALARRGYVFGA
ncbi:archaellum biogenesis protein FlaJ (TadC family) [Xanthomonas arboricola]|uniref:hypothetical protein n=1 Tax=Xanthomonas sp. 3793 TaxID=3035312 RepID=UPI002167E7DF|nr:hypothetical protein [Xanthomonas sp. 3793]MCS3744949.1 archaellum biogenesis protein FlaJ (TadC family) [Xanthomonas sp. 3793]